MNHRLIALILSRVALAEAALIGLSGVVALCYGDPLLMPYGVPIALLLLAAFLLSRFKPKTKDFYAREGLLTVALSWLLLSAFGALPMYFGGMSTSYIDCLFEAVSGFTTTGSSILTSVENHPHGLLFWRSFTHWIGGMGVLVFLMAVSKLAGERSIHLMRAESPGPSVGKIAPRIRATAGILYTIYLAMTLLMIVMLLAGGMPLFDSVVNTFATAGTGGFGVKNISIAAYHSPYAEVVITVFMLLFSVNFAVYHLILLKKFNAAFKCEEMRWFFGIFAVATLIVTIDILPLSRGFAEALRLAAFQNASIMSTTGFATADFNKWPIMSQQVLVVLMIIGACAGSTGGGFKVSRLIILLKSIRRELSRMLHPRSVGTIKFEQRTVESEVSHGVLVYWGLYMVLVIVGCLLTAIDGFDHVTTVTAVLTTINNVGPGLALVGPAGNFSIFSPMVKLLLTLLMLIGRLEIFPMVMLFSPAAWKRK